ncbi:MAG TPA: LapA family protein [Burkholderiales bacterium]|nr:LapA family protein [Burkholderiales bacterium]
MKLITQLSWLLRALLFLALFAFALMNTQPVSLRFFLGRTWETPMILALLFFFACGAAFGILACLSRLFRQRREIQKLTRKLHASETRVAPPYTEG